MQYLIGGLAEKCGVNTETLRYTWSIAMKQSAVTYMISLFLN
ncbi:transcriptional regulator [Bacillus mycoides]|uniref:Transcriptional regulator n=1 Tax=Bacillus cereus TaxID=1396 RepID=A0A1S9V9X0_BACCE|nr:transcriptional regulator [Bacillus cereus]QWG32346.1 transcriptional regulator [Bacillus mycoides]QWG47741.1 transcriptional regulator [Bacillus mycoides]QWH10867.1 transcriptional regulator [Bacillus mycoides]TBX75973.1 transcriptional regulator [Bacillus mycoides]